MKIKLTVSQILRILKDHPAHYPITINMKEIDQEDLKEIVNLLKRKKR